MNITATPRYELRLEIPLEAVVALMKVAEKHYDSKCQMAAKPDGFISDWKRHIERATEHDFHKDIAVEFKHIDTSLKIMEMAGYGVGTIITKEELVLLHHLSGLFMRLARKLNELYTAAYTEFDESF